MELRKQTFTANGGKATVTVREAVGMDSYDNAIIFDKLTYDRTRTVEVNRASGFANMVLRSGVVGDLGFPWVDVDSDKIAMQVAFDGWQALPPVDILAWKNTLWGVDHAPLVQPPSLKKSVKASSEPLTDTSLPSTTPTSD